MKRAEDPDSTLELNLTTASVVVGKLTTMDKRNGA
jgi:hypothetical protein